MEVLIVFVFIGSLIQIFYGFFKGSGIPLFPRIMYLATFALVEILDANGFLGESHYLENYLVIMLMLQWVWGCIAFRIGKRNESGFLWGYFLGLIGVVVTLAKEKNNEAAG